MADCEMLLGPGLYSSVRNTGPKHLGSQEPEGLLGKGLGLSGEQEFADKKAIRPPAGPQPEALLTLLFL